MAHIPLGYRIVGGVAVIDETAAATVRSLYKNYLSGMGLTTAAIEAGLNTYHGTAKRILTNRHYLGDAFYPEIIDELTFAQAQEELEVRATKLGRTNLKQVTKLKQIPTKFHINEITKNYPDPVMQAEYIYSLIKSEVI